MSIYSRDNIAYQSMIDNMINNRMYTLARQNEREQKYADIASDTAKGLASTFARGMDYVQSANERAELENKLKDLESRRDTIRDAYTQSQDYQPYTTTPSYKASEYMSGYKNYDSSKDQWLRTHPGMTEEDYEQFVEYQNALYGGR